MKCPICGNEMEKGGLITDGVVPMWVPEEEFEKKGLKGFVVHNVKKIGKGSVLLGQTKIPNAWFCSNCNKIIGIFDVTGSSEHHEAVHFPGLY